MMRDPATATITNSSTLVESNDAYTKFILLKWTALLLQPNPTTSAYLTRINLPSFSDTLRQVARAEMCSEFTCDSAFSSKNLKFIGQEVHIRSSIIGDLSLIKRIIPTT